MRITDKSFKNILPQKYLYATIKTSLYEYRKCNYFGRRQFLTRTFKNVLILFLCFYYYLHIIIAFFFLHNLTKLVSLLFINATFIEKSIITTLAKLYDSDIEEKH